MNVLQEDFKDNIMQKKKISNDIFEHPKFRINEHLTGIILVIIQRRTKICKVYNIYGRYQRTGSLS